MTVTPKFSVAIVGGGVCGLTLALALQRRGLKAHIYEGTSKFGEIGAGIVLGLNALDIMSEIGVYDEICKFTLDPRKAELPGFTTVFANAPHEPILMTKNEGKKGWALMMRMQLLDALVKFVDPAYTHFNKRCLSITSDAETKVQTMHFKDGTTAQADVVLVANGVKSALRGMMIADTEPEAPADAIKGVSYSSLMNFRGLVRRENGLAMGVDTSVWRGITSCLGRDRHVVMYPVKMGQIINIAAYVREPSSVKLPPNHPTTEPATTEELLAHFPESDFAPEIQNLLKCIEKPTKWYMNIVYPHLETYSKGRVALLGDAAHAMLPFLGAGAGQGIEDAYLLAELLSNPQTTTKNVEEVLQVYSDVRRPRSQLVLDRSVQAGRISHGHGPSGFTKEGLREDLTTVDHWSEEAYVYPLNKNVDQALDILKREGIFAY